MDLIEYLRQKLSADDKALLRAELEEAGEVDYEALIRRVGSRLRKDERVFWFARSRVELRYEDLLELPEGRRNTILRNSSPVLLLLLFRKLIQQSWRERIYDSERSLKLARIAVEVGEAIARASYLAPEDCADLRAEGHAYLANAQRLNSEISAAERSLSRAEALMSDGTGDRDLKADFLMLLTFLRVTQGRCTEAASLAEREIALRKLLGHQEKLGFALVQRAWIGCMLGEPFDGLCRQFKDGLSRAGDPFLFVQALTSLADALAREGFGINALEILSKAELGLFSVDSDWLNLNAHWTRGLTYRALGDFTQAERELRVARDGIAASRAAYRSAIVSLDLACVYAAQGKLEDVKQLAEEAYAIFKAEGLEERALTAVVVLQEAVEGERVTEGLAVAVANFLARFPYNKALRFEWKDR